MGTWLTKNRTDILHDLCALDDLLTDEAVNEPNDRTGRSLDLAWWHVHQAIKRLREISR